MAGSQDGVKNPKYLAATPQVLVIATTILLRRAILQLLVTVGAEGACDHGGTGIRLDILIRRHNSDDVATGKTRVDVAGESQRLG